MTDIIKNLSDGNLYSLEEIAELTNTSIEYVEGVLNAPSVIQTCGDGSGVIYYMDIKYDTIVDGVGFRNTVYCAKCNLCCKGCHNPQSQNIRNGKPISVNKLAELLLENGNNITFSGGECSLQAKAFILLAKQLKQENRNLWLYSGYTYEQLMNKPLSKKLLQFIDVLVDGAYVESLRNLNLRFRGSSNQRIIDIPKTLEKGEVVLWQN